MTAANAVAKYNEMLAAIDRCHSIDVVVGIRNRAEALRHAARVARNHEAERKCWEIQLRAERKAGQLLREMRERGELAGHGGRRRSRSSPSILNLDDLGVSADESANWGRLADLTDAEFQRHLGEPGPLSRSHVFRSLVRQPEQQERRRGRPRIQSSRRNPLSQQNAWADKARALGTQSLRKLEDDPRACSAETVTKAKAVVEVWSTVVEAMQERLSGA